MRATSTLGAGIRLLLTSSALSLALAGSAYALDGNVVAERLKSTYAKQGGTLSFESVTTDGSNIVLKGTKVGAAGVDEQFTAGEITLRNVTETDRGGFRIETLALADGAHSIEEGTISVAGFEIGGLVLPPETSTDPLDGFLFYENAKIDKIDVTIDGKPFVELSDMLTTMSPLTKDAPVDFTSKIGSMNVDLTSTDDQETLKALTDLGYQKFSGRMDMTGSWNPSDGRMKADKMDFTLDDGGTFGMTFDISGYTMDFIKGLQDAQALAEKSDDGDAAGMAMLGLMQQLTFNSASIRFDDASLTNKLLDYFAKQQGMERTDLINQSKMMVPMLAAQLKNANFAAQVSEAVGKYLDDPKSIEIRATPQSPVPMALLAATGYAQPETLVDTLGVTVMANQ